MLRSNISENDLVLSQLSAYLALTMTVNPCSVSYAQVAL